MALRLLRDEPSLRLLKETPQPSLAEKVSKGIRKTALKSLLAPIAPPPVSPETTALLYEKAHKPERLLGEAIGRGYEAIPEPVRKRLLPKITPPPITPLLKGIRGQEEQFQKQLLQRVGSLPASPEFLGMAMAGLTSPRTRPSLIRPKAKLPRNLNQLSNLELMQNYQALGRRAGLQQKLTPARFSDFMKYAFKMGKRPPIPLLTSQRGGAYIPSGKELQTLGRKFNLSTQQLEAISKGTYAGLPSQVVRAIGELQPEPKNIVYRTEESPTGKVKGSGMYVTDIKEYAEDYLDIDEKTLKPIGKIKTFEILPEAKIYKAKNVEILHKELFGKEVYPKPEDPYDIQTTEESLATFRKAERAINKTIKEQGYDIIEYAEESRDNEFEARTGMKPTSKVILNPAIIKEAKLPIPKPAPIVPPVRAEVAKRPIVEAKPISSELQPLAQEAKKYKSAEEFKALGFEAIQKELFGVNIDDIVEVPINQIEIKWKDDLKEAERLAKKRDITKITEPVEFIFDIKKNKYILDDGHNRYVAARRQGIPLKGKITATEGNIEEMAIILKEKIGQSITDFYNQATAKPTPLSPEIKRLPLLEGKKRVAKVTQLPKGETFGLVGLPKPAGISPKRRLAEEQLGFKLIGKPKTIKIKPKKIIKPKLLLERKLGQLPVATGQIIPRFKGKGFEMIGMPKKVGVSPKERLLQEQKRIQEEKLGFILKGKPKEIKIRPENLATVQQMREAHIIAKQKALVTPKGKTTPQYRRLARGMTGKSSMRDMTREEASGFIASLKGISEPYYKKGRLIPPSIPKTTKVVPEGFFKREFKEPTIMKNVTSQTYYSQLLGVKPLVEPLEIAKQKFDLAYREKVSSVDKIIVKINKLGKTTPAEFTQAKIKNVPTRAVSRMRDLLDKYEEAPAFLSSKDKEVFNWFRSLNRTILESENAVRKSLDLEPIKYRKAYVRHTAEVMAKEMLLGKYPFPQGLKYWSQKIIGKKIYNPMEFQRKLADDLENLWTKDLGHATKSMLYTGLKEIHLSKPLKFLTEQLGAVSKDPAVYKDLTPEEKEIYNQQTTMPASTKKWIIDYVNQVIKGQETDLDASINRLVTTSGLRGIFNKILAPFGRTVGRKPITGLFQTMGRATIHGVMGPIRPKQLLRNKFQLTQNLALYTLKANLKGFLPATKQMKQLMSESLFLKTYTGFEELPTNIQGKLERLNLAPFQWTAVSNVSQSMKVAYWDTLDLIENPKYRELGWADPARTYEEPSEFLYSSEREKILKEMEFGSGITQYGYIPMAMPEIFRHKALIPFTRLQSWWMNHFFKFNREAITRGLKGETGYGTKLPWSRRIGWLRYLILGGAILNTLDYERSFLFGAAPTGLPPTAQFMLGLYTYLTTGEKTAWEKRKKAEAKRRMFYAMKTFIPGYLAWKDFNALMSGKKSLKEYFFYKKIEARPKPTRFEREPFKRERFERKGFKGKRLRLLGETTKSKKLRLLQ